MINYLPEAINLARDSHKVFAVLFVDLDDFKNINDTLGHAVGDELLKAAASRLKAAIRPEDKVARLGGDEFTIIVESAQSREEVAAVAERIINTLQSPFVLGDGDRQYYVHASIGISMFPENGLTDSPCLNTPTLRCTRPRNRKREVTASSSQAWNVVWLHGSTGKPS